MRRYLSCYPCQSKDLARQGFGSAPLLLSVDKHKILCRVLELAEECDTMLVVGSSLMVYSAFRLSKAAKAGNGRLAILSAGPTRADSMVDLKVYSSLQDTDHLHIAGSLCMLRRCPRRECM